MKAKIKRSRDGKWYALLIGKNNRIVWQTEMYDRRAGARNAIAVLERNGLLVDLSG